MACLYRRPERRGFTQVRVKYLITSEELKENVESQDLLDYGLRTACYFGYIDIVKFLMEEPLLKNKANVYSVDETEDNAFILACTEDNIVEYFVFERDIDRTSIIQNYIDLNNAEHIDKLFQVRELNNLLEMELKSNKVKSNKLEKDLCYDKIDNKKMKI